MLFRTSWKPPFPCQSYDLREAYQWLYHLCGGPSKDSQQNHIDYILAYLQEIIKVLKKLLDRAEGGQVRRQRDSPKYVNHVSQSRLLYILSVCQLNLSTEGNKTKSHG